MTQRVAAATPTWRSQVWADSALALTVTTVIAVAISADSPTSGADPRHLDAAAYLFAVGLGALMFARRSYPIAVLLVTALGTCAYYICKYPPIGLAIPMGAALYVAAAAGRMRWAVAAVTVVLSLSLYFRVQQGEQVRYLLLYDTLLTVAVMAIAVGFGAARRANQLLHDETRERTRQAAIMLEQEARARVQHERARLARDLHDSLGHTMALIAVQADVAVESAPDLPPETRQALTLITAATRRAMTELRSAVGILRTPEPHTPTPSLTNLPHLADEVSTSGVHLTIESHGDLDRVPPLVGATAYRIVQESLTNAIRHSHSHRVSILLTASKDTLDVRIHNDGDPSMASSGTVPGHGIRSMTERAHILGGSLTAGPDPTGGWVVHAALPTAPT